MPSSDGLLTGFSGVYGGYTAGYVVRSNKENGASTIYDSRTLLRDMRTAGIHPDAPERDMSMDSKKMLYVTYSFVNDIVKNQGLSQESRDKLTSNGYVGEFFDDATMSESFWANMNDEIHIFDNKPSIDDIRNKSKTGNSLVITKADYVAYVASNVAGFVYSLDGGNEPVGIARGGERSSSNF